MIFSKIKLKFLGNWQHLPQNFEKRQSAFGSTSVLLLLVFWFWSKMATAKSETVTLPLQKYGRIVLTLDNVLIPPEKLNPSPSCSDGLDNETEFDLRVLGCEMIQTSGILLRLPQVSETLQVISSWNFLLIPMFLSSLFFLLIIMRLNIFEIHCFNCVVGPYGILPNEI